MTITSTEFQQNVGYYLNEAQKGKVLTITKSKPTKVSFKLVVQNNIEPKTQKKKFDPVELEKLIAKLNIQSHESGLEFQRRVRQ